MNNRKVMRGEVYYIHSFPTSGHEQKSGRPAVIVSNNENNATSGTYEICYMTLQDKPDLPTHVFIDRGPCINSTILCEQVTTITKEKLGDFMCHIPEHLEGKLDKALAVSLGLTTERAKCAVFPSTRGVDVYAATPQVVLDELACLKQEISSLNAELDSVNTKRDAIEAMLNISNEAVDVAKARADMYERMYNDLLDRLVKRG